MMIKMEVLLPAITTNFNLLSDKTFIYFVDFIVFY